MMNIAERLNILEINPFLYSNMFTGGWGCWVLGLTSRSAKDSEVQQTAYPIQGVVIAAVPAACC